jgi:hypothetical protein
MRVVSDFNRHGARRHRYCGNAKRMHRDHRVLDCTAAAFLMAARLFPGDPSRLSDAAAIAGDVAHAPRSTGARQSATTPAAAGLAGPVAIYHDLPRKVVPET